MMSTPVARIDEILAALADPTRRQVLEVIAARGEATATVIATQVPVSRQAIVKHLAILTRAGLVGCRRHGREVRYTVQPEGLATTARWLAARAAAWDARLERLKQITESDTMNAAP
jgi:DNA-binding transcriptional ArsR family regulator